MARYGVDYGPGTRNNVPVISPDGSQQWMPADMARIFVERYGYRYGTGGTGPGANVPTVTNTAGPVGNIWREWYQEAPEAQFFNIIRAWGSTPAQQRYWQTQYGPLYSRYMGYLGSVAAGGRMPRTTFTQWLRRLNPTAEWERLPAYMRGINFAKFAPRSRWFNY